MALAHAPQLRSRAAPFAGSRVALRAKAAPRAVAARPAPCGPRAGLFDFLQPKEEPAAAAKLAYICLDCGYIYNGDLSKESFFYKCPVCDVGKNRFQKQQAAGSAYKELAAAKKAAKAAKAASSSGGERPRDKLKREAMERAAKFDADRGRGGDKDKKKGWFG